jgi:septum formation protein
VQPSSVEEPPTDHFSDPVAYAVHTAWLKANAVVDAGTIVVGADTIVAHDNAIIGKPADRADAERILRLLSGTEHRVITGLCLVVPSIRVSLVDHVVTPVSMRTLSEAELSQILDSGLWEGKAGAYGIQDNGDPFVTTRGGSVTNVIGLPMERLAQMLASARLLTSPPAS